LLDADVVAQVEAERRQLDPRTRARTADGLHDLLLRLGDLTLPEIEARAEGLDVKSAVEALTRDRRALTVNVVRGAGAPGSNDASRVIPVEYASRYRDALGVPLPVGLPESLLGPAADAAGDLARRFARTHGPFTTGEFAARYGLSVMTAADILNALLARGQLVHGEFRPGGAASEWCDPDVLQIIRRRSLAKLRRQVAPVEPAALGRLVTTWQGVTRPRRGLDALLDVVETLQGAALPASLLEREILPARIEMYQPGDLDTLAAAGEIAWVGAGSLGEHDGRVALYLTDALPRLLRPANPVEPAGSRELAIVKHLESRGASFFSEIHEAAGGGFPAETVDAIWALVWKGLLTNDTFHAVRAYTRAPARRARRPATGGRVPFRTRRVAPATAEGRWSSVRSRLMQSPSPTEWAAAVAEQLLARYGVVTREVAAAEDLPGGFSAVYEVFRALEDRGRIRRGYFVSGVGAMQFAQPSAVEMLRSLSTEPEEPEVVTLAATDPANPYGALLRWPEGLRGATRTVGATVILVDGAPGAWIARGARHMLAWVPDEEPARSRVGRALAARLAELARDAVFGGLLVGDINGAPASQHPLAEFLVQSGFVPSALGFQMRA
jgi:ATP-dependent Lhr-like helicase